MTKEKYVRHLLRESYRENKKVKHRTIANLSSCTPEEIQAIKLALTHKKELEAMLTPVDDIQLKQGPSFGAVWLVHQIACRLGIDEALGHHREGKLALWQVIARVIDQGSRLSAVRFADNHAVCDMLGLDRTFDEDTLYRNLSWLHDQQTDIEKRLFQRMYPQGEKPGLFLYDVTSSYLEGTQNEWAAFGYNRDKKSGKKQIVIGLLCDQAGRPLAIEVFPGNTVDTETVASQIRKVAEQFGGGEVTFVGDRGMIKSQQVEDLLSKGFHYITAITKPQIETLLAQHVIDMSLFDQELAEIQSEARIRYVLRRNPVRAAEMSRNRDEKEAKLHREGEKLRTYLGKHQRAKVATAYGKLWAKAKRLKLDELVQIEVLDRAFCISRNTEAWDDAAKFDGCYVLKTDLSAHQLSKEAVHNRYKDLTKVEWAFRTSKTTELEMRPVYLRKADRTSAHALVVMLAYKITQELSGCWHDLNTTVQEGLHQLETLCITEVEIAKQVCFSRIPQPNSTLQILFDHAHVSLPENLSWSGPKVSTRKQLQKERKALPK